MVSIQAFLNLQKGPRSITHVHNISITLPDLSRIVPYIPIALV